MNKLLFLVEVIYIFIFTDTDSSIFPYKTNKELFEDLNYFEEDSDFRNLDACHSLYSEARKNISKKET